MSLLYNVFTGESSFLSHPICLVNDVYLSGRLDSTCDSTDTLFGVLEIKKMMLQLKSKDSLPICSQYTLSLPLEDFRGKRKGALGTDGLRSFADVLFFHYSLS